MTIALDGKVVFKEENVNPLTYTDVMVKYRGISEDLGFADAKIRKLRIKSFDFKV